MKKMNLRIFGFLFSLAMLAFCGQVSAQTFTGGGNPQPIPTVGTGGFPCTGGPVTSVATVAGLAGTIGPDHFIDNVTLDLTHTWDSDIEADLISPDGTIWDLTSDNGGAGDNFTGTIFMDGAPSITTGSAPFTGTFQAEQGPFATGFDGDVVNGNWTLSICDDAGGDTGTLLGFTITFGQPCAIIPPADVVVSADPGVCEATLTGLLAMAPTCTDPTTNDFNAGGLDASGTYPVGTTTVTFTSGMSTASFNVTVTDDEAPTFTNCPNDLTVTLDPGDCAYYFNYLLEVEDNCPSMGPVQTLTHNNDLAVGSITNSVGCPGGGYETWTTYDMSALGITADFTLTDVTFGVFQTFGTPTVTANVYTIASIPAVGSGFTAADVTLIGTGSLMLPAGGNSVQTLTLDMPTTIPAGADVAIELVSPNGTFTNGFIPGYNTAGLTNGQQTYLTSTFCNVAEPTPIQNILGGFTDRFMAGLIGFQSAPIVVNQLAGDPSGTPLTEGTYTYSFEATDQAGNVGTCDFTVTVENFPNPVTSLSCNQAGIQVSLADNCEATIGADDILEGGPYGCYDNYTVELFYDELMYQPLPTSPVVTGADLGQTRWARVTAPDGNSCWGVVYVEDKQIPDLECTSLEIPCADENTPGASYAGIQSIESTIGLATQDNNTVSQDFTISGVSAIPTDINVGLDMSHTWVGDLVITVTSPAGTSVELLNNIGGPGFGCAGNDLDITLDDEAAATYADLDGTCNNAPAAAGSFQPLEALSAFDGEDVNGTWTVSIEDLVGGDGGMLNTLTLELSVPGLNTVPFPVPTTATVFQTNAQRGSTEYTVRNFDGCSDVILGYYDTIEDIDCLADPANPYTKVITRVWTATDASGNSTTCQDTLNLIRATIADIVLPRNYDDQDLPSLSCELREPASSAFCGLELGWNAIDNGQYAGHPDPIDELYPCGAVKWAGDGCFKIIRNWTILDWCTGELANHTQVIKVSDDEGPTITDLADVIISTDVWSCTATYYVPQPWIMDNCSDFTGDYRHLQDSKLETYLHTK